MDMEKNRVLVIGGTGNIGKHIVAASVHFGHPTSILIREFAPSDIIKVQLLNSWVKSGASPLKVPISSMHHLLQWVSIRYPLFPCLLKVENLFLKNKS
jgi:nucleoside-diphosphate-sugar epimerase